MLLKSGNISFALTIVGYQFRAITTAEYDSNWLNVGIDVVHPRGNWSRVDPALLTYEVERLAVWLERIGSPEPPTVSASFLEPNLEFELSSNANTLRVYFRLEFAPPWATHSNLEEDYEYPFIELPLKDLNLQTAGQSLRDQLSRFPQRARR